MFVVISSGFTTEFWVVHQKCHVCQRPTPHSFFRPYLISCQVCQHDNSKESSSDLLFHPSVTPVGPLKALFALILFEWLCFFGEKMFCEPALVNRLFQRLLWACLLSYDIIVYTSNCSDFVKYFPELVVLSWKKCFQLNLFLWMFCQLFDNMCPALSLLNSQTAPNTCMALTEQFDLSTCIVIGGPGLVIHGPFDCWHVKC